MPLTPAEQRELDELEYQKLMAERAASGGGAAPTPAPTSPTPPPPPEPVTTNGKPTAVPTRGPIATPLFIDVPGQLASLKQFIAADTRPLPSTSAKEWAQAGPAERAGMLLRNFTHYAKQPVADVVNAGTGMALRAGAPAIGQAAGRLVPLPAADRVLGAVGGGIGEFAAQMQEGGPIRAGAIGANALMGLRRGVSLANPSAGRLATESAKDTATNIVGKAVETQVDEGRPPTPQEMTAAAMGAAIGTAAGHVMDAGTNAIMQKADLEKTLQASKRLTLKLGNELGYVIPPSLVNPSGANNFVNSIGGKAATMQEVVQRNQKITNAAIVEELGLPVGTTLGLNERGVSPALNSAKAGPFAVYDKVKASSPQAEAALELFREYQNEATRFRSAFNASYPKNLELDVAAKKAQQQADEAAKLLKDELKATPELYDQFREARIKLGKISLVEEALEGASGDINAQVIGRAWERSPHILTGKLATIGRFANQFPQTIRLAELSPAPGVNQLLPVAGGSIGAMSGEPGRVATALGALTAIPQMARDTMLSPAYQRNFAQYTAGPTSQDMAAVVARFAGQNYGRQPAFPPAQPMAPPLGLSR